MKIEDKIRNEKLQYDANREETTILALTSGKIDQHGFLTSEEILPFDQTKSQIQLFPSENVLEKRTKITEDPERKQIKALKFLKPNTQQLIIKNAILEDQQIKKTKLKLIELKKIEKVVNSKELIFISKKICIQFPEFLQFTKDIRSGNIILNNNDESQNDLSIEIVAFEKNQAKRF